MLIPEKPANEDAISVKIAGVADCMVALTIGLSERTTATDSKVFARDDIYYLLGLVARDVLEAMIRVEHNTVRNIDIETLRDAVDVLRIATTAVERRLIEVRP